jgi:hypothetical protein
MSFTMPLKRLPRFWETEAERVGAGKMMKIPADKHPVESVVVADKPRLPTGNRLDPFSKTRHHLGGLLKFQGLLTCMSRNRQRLYKSSPFIFRKRNKKANN